MLTLPRIPPGVFGDEAGVLRRWDGERWGAAVADGSVVPDEVVLARLEAQIAAFARAGYRVVAQDRRSAVLELPERPRRLGSLRRRAQQPRAARIVIAIDGAGAVRFAA